MTTRTFTNEETQAMIEAARAESFEAIFSEELCGFELIFKDKTSAHTQFNIETNALHADYKETYLERYSEFDTATDKDEAIDEFIDVVNSYIYNNL